MKQKLILIPILVLLAAVWMITTSAAPNVATLSLTDVTLNGCNNSTFSGNYRITARDAQGNVVNTTTGVGATGVYEANGTIITDSYPHTTTLAWYDIYFPGQSLTSAVVYFHLTSNPTIRSESYLLDCPSLTATIIRGSSGGGDDRLNPGTGDLINVLYARSDTSGHAEIHVYTLDSLSRGVLIGKFTYSDFAPYLDQPPQTNTWIAKIGDSNLYVLSTGEFQINIGPDAEKKLYSVIIDQLPPKSVVLKSAG